MCDQLHTALNMRSLVSRVGVKTCSVVVVVILILTALWFLQLNRQLDITKRDAVNQKLFISMKPGRAIGFLPLIPRPL